VEARQGDVTDPAGLVEAQRGADIVINSVQFPGSPVENKRKGWTFEAVDYQGTVNQVAAAKAAGVRRFVYVSAIGAAPDGDRHWFRLKWQAEQAVRGSGLDWSIVRPTWVIGPGAPSLARILAFGKFLPFIPFFGDGKFAMQPVFIDDVARVVADAALKPEATGKVMELGGPEIVTMNEVIQAALAAQGKKRFILHQPVFLGKLIGRVAGLLPTPPLSADAVDFITRPAVGDNTVLMETLHPRLTPMREALAASMNR
jgi:NADH dehydrogenase